jgi:hypothetical protein
VRTFFWVGTLSILGGAFAIFASHPAAARGNDFRDIRNSVHCLAHDPFQLLGRRNSRAISLIISRDDLSYRHEQHLWIFAVRGGGVYDVFDVQMKRHPRKAYELRNSATVKWDGKTLNDFKPLLGGLWTHDVMRQNFREALRSRPIVMRLSERGGARPFCGSYTSRL